MTLGLLRKGGGEGGISIYLPLNCLSKLLKTGLSISTSLDLGGPAFSNTDIHAKLCLTHRYFQLYLKI